MNMSETPEKTQQKQDTRFQRGQSGNPAGRRRGSRNRASVLAQQLFDGECERLVRAVIERALSGDVMALRICIERLLAPRRDAPLSLKLPKVRDASDISKAMEAITVAVADGELLPSEGEKIAGLLDVHRRALETSVIEQRLAILEAKVGNKS